MTDRRPRALTLSPLALLVAMLALIALTGSGVAVANGHHHRGGGNGAPRTESELTNLTMAKDRVKLYYGDTVDATQPAGYTHQASPTSNYAKEVAGVERHAAKYLDRKRHTNHRAIVLDVDDTSVLTYEYDANNDFGYIPSINAQYVAHGFPAVYGMPGLVNWAKSKGYAVFFITGRPDSQHADTVANLQGRELDGQTYPVVTSGSLSPQGDSLFTKPADPATRPYLDCNSDGVPACSTVEYKSGTRAYIESHGYDIVANFGDQFSDLSGGSADRGFKLPNPMYYLP
jgi:predicted secreted acid phosphatase